MISLVFKIFLEMFQIFSVLIVTVSSCTIVKLVVYADDRILNLWKFSRVTNYYACVNYYISVTNGTFL